MDGDDAAAMIGTNKNAPTPIIHMPYLDIGEDLKFEGRVATPPSDIMFRKA